MSGAIGQLTNYILVREPDWALPLWINWDGATTPTVRVRDFYTLAMPIAASPWWTYWPGFPYDAAENIIGAIYLMQLTTPKFGASSDNITISDFGLTATRTTQTFTVTPPAGVPPQTALSTPSAVGQVYAEIRVAPRELCRQRSFQYRHRNLQLLTGSNNSVCPPSSVPRGANSTRHVFRRLGLG